MLSALMLLGGAAALLWSAAGPLELPVPPARLQALVPPVPPAPPFPSLSQFAHIGQSDLRLSRPDPEQATGPVQTAAAAVPMRFRLLGTAVESGRPFAVFADEMQRPIVRTINQLIDGFRVTGIERKKVTVEQQSRRVDLSIPDTYPGAGQ